MSRRKEEPARPLFPTFHEYEAARKAHFDAATVLHNTVRTIVLSCKTGEQALRAIPLLKEADDAYNRATYGD